MGASQAVKFAYMLAWVATGALQYGFHISALNSSQGSIMCERSVPRRGALGLRTCLDVTQFGFGVVTSAYTLGGLASSLYTGNIADARGRKATALISAWLVVMGGVAIAFATNVTFLILGRVLIGLSCGISTVLVPLYLSEISPPAIRGNIGVLTQLSICAGILLAQSISIPLSAPGTGYWRIIPLVSAGIAGAQIGSSMLMIETKDKQRSEQLYDVNEDDEERAPLAAEDPVDPPASRAASAQDQHTMSVRQVLSSPDPAVKTAWRTLALSQFFQQTSGINSVMYFSVGILTAVNPANAKLVAVFVTLVNFFMTLPAVYLIDRLGRKFLLVFSLVTMCIASIVLAYSINNSKFVLAATFIVLFVATFSVGLGPIPFVLTGELAPPASRSATASIALAVNWLSNFFIGLTFLPLRDWLSGGRAEGSGTVFYVFAVMSALGAIILGKRLSA